MKLAVLVINIPTATTIDILCTYEIERDALRPKAISLNRGEAA